MRTGINHKVSHDSGPLPKSLTSVKHGSRGNLGHTVAGQPKFLRRPPEMGEREAILDSMGLTHLPAKFHPTHKATRRPKMNSTLIATSTAAGTVIDAYRESKPSDLVPMRQSAKIQPRLKDTSAVPVRVLAKEIGLTPKAVIDAIMKEQGEFIASANSNIPGPVVRMFMEHHGFINAELAPASPAKDAEVVIGDMHGSTHIANACIGNCAIFECKCGAKWIGHDLMFGCQRKGEIGYWGCPVEREQRSALLAERTGFARDEFTLISA